MKKVFSLSDYIRKNCFAQQDNGIIKTTKRLLNNYLHCLETSKNLSISDGIFSLVTNINDSIIKCINFYLNARVDEAIVTMKSLIECHKNDFLSFDISKNNKNTVWYRARLLNDCRYYTHMEMFHIPFEERRKIESQRFSITGYPCLYLGRTIYSCWIEMGEPALTSFAVSRFVATKPIKLLDLRLHENTDFNNTKLMQYLKTLPLIIACSLKLKEPHFSFRPEYIIPQLLTLALAQNDSSYKGINYTSVQINDRFHWPSRCFDNIAIPVRSSANKGHCKVLKKWFKCTNSTTYEQELVKAAMIDKDDGIYDSDNKDGYKDSIFYSLEDRLSQFELHQLR